MKALKLEKEPRLRFCLEEEGQDKRKFQKTCVPVNFHSIDPAKEFQLGFRVLEV